MLSRGSFFFWSIVCGPPLVFATAWLLWQMGLYGRGFQGGPVRAMLVSAIVIGAFVFCLGRMAQRTDREIVSTAAASIVISLGLVTAYLWYGLSHLTT